MGKTFCAIMVAAHRLKELPKSKILMLAPTRPLVNQHFKRFKEIISRPDKDFVALTGKVHARDRKVLYTKGKLFFATPQLIRNDIENKILDLNNYSLLVVDECLSENSKILLADYSSKNIKDVVEEFLNGKDVYVLSLDTKTKRFLIKKVVNAQKIPCLKSLIEIKIGNKIIKATEDHAFLVKRNKKMKWIAAGKLMLDDKLVSFPVKLSGDIYDSKPLVTEKDVIDTFSQKQRKYVEEYRKVLKLRRKFKFGSLIISRRLNIGLKRVDNWVYRNIKPIPLKTTDKMKKMGLLPISYSNPRIRIIARIVGHLFGDGWSCVGKNGTLVLGFSGRVQNLKRIQDDLKLLGIKCSNIHSRKTQSRIKGVKVKGSTNSFTCSDSRLTRLLRGLGIPISKKTQQKTEVPGWIMNGPRYVKREFLSSLFGSDADCPLQIKNSRGFYCIRYTINKIEELEKNAKFFMNQIKYLLEEFNVKTTEIKTIKGNIRKDKTKTIKIMLRLSNSTENLIAFFEKVSYVYCIQKERKAAQALNYLLEKKYSKSKIEEVFKKTLEMKKEGFSNKLISEALNIPIYRVERWVCGAHGPRRIPLKFSTFDEWSKDSSKLPVVEKGITGIKFIQKEDYVYDLTVEDTHNFIANSFVVHNCHRSVKRYAYTAVVEEYVKQSSNPLILGLTASPGGIQEKIDEVKKNLYIKAVEIRTEKDVDVEPYIQDIAIQQVYVELPEEFKSVRRKLEEVYREKLNSLMRMRLLHSMRVSKRNLLDLQKEVGKLYQESKDFMTAKALSLCAQAIKLEHAIMLIETEGVSSLQKYFSNTMKKQKSMATRTILKDSRIVSAIRQTEDMYVKGVEHPKMKKLLDIVKEELKKNPRSKIIVFANYRSSVDKIAGMLQANKIEAREFIGQAIKSGKGLNQKRQIELLNEFGYEMFNVLVSTSVGEEGIDVPAVDLAIFYEPVPSEIRTIQRRGRTGRQKAGRVIFLITKGTRDEGYYWSAYHKERRMKRIIKDMKDGFKNDYDKKLTDFTG